MLKRRTSYDGYYGPFEINTGVRQVCILSTLLSIIYMDKIAPGTNAEVEVRKRQR